MILQRVGLLEGGKIDAKIDIMRPEFDINSSVWVSASAGSGKTTILIRRLLNMILNDVDISKIICITYTKTAAGEMKERIYDALNRWTKIDENLLKNEIESLSNTKANKEKIKKARTLFAKTIDNIDNLKIFTIHSFCQQILCKFPIEAGISPNFEILDEYQSNELISKAIDETLHNAKSNFNIYESIRLLIKEKNENDFYDFINYLISKRKDLELIKNNYNDYLKDLFKIDFNDDYCLLMDFLSYNFDYLLKVCNNNSCKNSNIEKIKNYIIKINESKKENDINKLWSLVDDYVHIFLTKKNEKRSNFSNDLSLEQERCFDFQKKLLNFKCYKLTISSIKISFDIIDNYKILKNQKGVLDFDDLIIKTKQLLENTEYSDWIKYKLDNGIEHILVDEAQDTSILQWEIIKYLTSDFFTGINNHENPRSIFVVGDEKQSIYGFQDANPEMFGKMYNFYKEIINNSRNIFAKIDLNKSFRSLDVVLNFIDNVFSGYEDKISNIDKNIKHNNTRNGVGLVELWPLIDVKQNKKEKTWSINFDSDEETKKQELLAKYIADKIENLLTSNRAIVGKNGEKRKIKYEDIMVLVKNRNKIFLSYLIKNLNKKGIPNSGLDKLSMFDGIVIKDILSLFTFILFQNDDLSLANIVKSPILSMKEEDLYKLCRYKIENNISLFSSLKYNYHDKYEFLSLIIEKSKKSSIYDLCCYILNICKIKENIISRYGNESYDIINKFLDFVYNYEINNDASLLPFLNFVENNINEVKKDLETSNQVRIMTIHASKGLQSPIVFIIDANSGVDSKQDKILWYKYKNYINIPCYKINNGSEIIEKIKNYGSNCAYNEYLRLFYVALTRAENEIYICGLEHHNNAKDNKSWYKIAEATMKRINCRSMNFDFNNSLEKLVYGDYNYLDMPQYEECDKIKVDFESQKIELLLKNIGVHDYSKYKQKIISPSQYYNYVDKDKIIGNNIHSVEKGKIIHKLLEILPRIELSNRQNIFDMYTNNTDIFTRKEIHEICQIVTGILNNINLKPFFSENSNSEVNIVGEIDGDIVSGRIDRIVELDDKILVLDYKNTVKDYKNEIELPKEYIKQMEIYKKLVEKTNKNKLVECYILTTTYGRLIRVF